MGLIEQISDKPSRARIRLLHPLVRESAAFCYLEAEKNLSGKNTLRVTYGLRTMEEQAALYRKGRDGKGGKIVTNAGPFQSYHNYGLALDYCLLHPDGKASWSIKEDLDDDGIADWYEVATAFKVEGWEWGGEWNKFKDHPHVQKRFGYHWRELEQLWNAGKRDSDGYVIITPRTGYAAQINK